MREQMLKMLWGGPGANLAVAATMGAAAWAGMPHPGAWLCLAFGVMNLWLALANLVPRQKVLPSDGLALLQWWRDADAIDVRYLRLISLSAFGCTADRLPVDDIAALEAQPAPMPLIAMWYRLKALQHRGAWQAVAEQDALDPLLEAMDGASRTACADLAALLRTEIAFSAALARRDAAGLYEELLPKRTAWYAPWLPLRCEALRAVLAGDLPRCLRALARSKRHAENAVDRSLPLSEAMIRAGMAAVFEHAWDEAVIDAASR
jgi:hypothetical protein